MSTPLRVVLVDDEPLAREGLRLRLARHRDIIVVAECGTLAAGQAALAALAPDVVFLDIQLGSGDGFGVVRERGDDALPCVIFVTAFAEHAVRAFRTGATDYLLKPIEDAALDQALLRARHRVCHVRARNATARLPVPSIQGVNFVEPGHIVRIDSDGDHVHIRTATEEYRVRMTLRSLEAQLDPRLFVRIHRTAIVAIREIAGLRPYGRNEHVVLLRDGTQLPLSRRARAAVVAAITARG